MSLSAKQELHRLLSQYSKDQEKFLSYISLINPEPQIIAFSKQFLDFSDLHLSRTIKWRELRSDYFETNPLWSCVKDLELFPFSDLLEIIDLDNLHAYLNPGYQLDGKLLAFKIEKVVWFIKLWSDRNGYAPPYAPKNLSSGLKTTLSPDEGLFVTFQAVDKELWYTYEINPVKVVPVTTENFSEVLAFHRLQALKHFPPQKEK